MTAVAVAGYLVRHPVGGNAWTFAHYVAGLARLGIEVVYVEESGWEQSCFDPRSGRYGNDPAAGLDTARHLFALLGVHVPVLYVDRATGEVHGGDRRTLETLLGRCDALLDVGGVCDLPEFGLAGRRALVDLDPGFTQAGRFGGRDLDRYDVHFSYGLNVGRDTCPIPTHGLAWQPTVPPVVLDAWVPVDRPRRPHRFTTVASWDAYGTVAIGGRELGQKDTQLRAVMPLASRSPYPLEVALAAAPAAVVEGLRDAGWIITGAEQVREVGAYRRYLQDSAGEFSVAKQAYVETRSGWVSDRTACYLAAGRPAVVEDTGAGDALPLGEGLLTFRDEGEALAALEAVAAAPARHAVAAAELARTVFDAGRVLASLVDRTI